jgi:hypothetical protein
LTTWRDDSLWVALVSAGGKVEDTQTIVLSNAGYDAGAASSWQWSVRQTADEADWGYLFSAPGVIASWITPSWVEQMRALLPSAAFDRLIGNVWTTGAGDFVTQQQWRACVDERLTPTRTGGGRRFGALDLGLVKDRTAISVLHWEDDLLVLDQLDVWEGSRDEPVSIRVIENALLDAARRYPGLEIYCDPWQFKGSMERLRDHLRLREFTFSASSVQKLSAVLHHAITSAALRVYPDADLEREILGLRVVESAGGWRFDHRRGGFSDRAVSLGMAVMLAHERGRPRGERGSWVCRDAIPEIDAVALGATVAGYG